MNVFLSNLDISLDRYYVTTPLQSLLAVISSLLSYFALPPAMGSLVSDFFTSKLRSHSLAFFPSLLPNPAFILMKIITMRTALEDLCPNLTMALAITRTALVALLSSDDRDLTWNRATIAAIVTPSRTTAPAASAPSRAWHALAPPELIVLVLAFAFYLFCAYTRAAREIRNDDRLAILAASSPLRDYASTRRDENKELSYLTWQSCSAPFNVHDGGETCRPDAPSGIPSDPRPDKRGTAYLAFSSPKTSTSTEDVVLSVHRASTLVSVAAASESSESSDSSTLSRSPSLYSTGSFDEHAGRAAQQQSPRLPELSHFMSDMSSFSADLSSALCSTVYALPLPLSSSLMSSFSGREWALSHPRAVILKP